MYKQFWGDVLSKTDIVKGQGNTYHTLLTITLKPHQYIYSNKHTIKFKCRKRITPTLHSPTHLVSDDAEVRGEVGGGRGVLGLDGPQREASPVDHPHSLVLQPLLVR